MARKGPEGPGPCPTGGGDEGPSPITHTFSLMETKACVDPHGNKVTPYYAMEVTYQLYIDGAPAYSNTQMTNLGAFVNSIWPTLILSFGPPQKPIVLLLSSFLVTAAG